MSRALDYASTAARVLCILFAAGWGLIWLPHLTDELLVQINGNAWRGAGHVLALLGECYWMWQVACDAHQPFWVVLIFAALAVCIASGFPSAYIFLAEYLVGATFPYWYAVLVLYLPPVLVVAMGGHLRDRRAAVDAEHVAAETSSTALTHCGTRRTH